MRYRQGGRDLWFLNCAPLKEGRRRAAYDISGGLAQVIAWLQREQRVSYRAIQRQLALDDDYLEDFKNELIHAKKLAADEEGRVLVWIGVSGTTQVPTSQVLQSEPLAATLKAHPTLEAPSPVHTWHP
jgi:hypothetical protein